jgi:hypothetical protein
MVASAAAILKRFQAERGGGRFYEIVPDGILLPSVTNLLSVIGKPAVINWAAKVAQETTVEAAANLWEDIPTGPKKMSRTAYVATLTERIGKTKAHVRELAKAAEIGSQVHALIEWNLRRELGQEVGPEPVIKDAALWAFMVWEEWRKTVRLKPLAVEQVVWSRQYRYAGTLDLLATLDGPDGKVTTVLDWKTGKAIYGEAKLQNAAYVQAAIEMGHAAPPIQGCVVRLPKVETDPSPEMLLIPPDAQPGLFGVFRHVQALWEWQASEDAERTLNRHADEKGQQKSREPEQKRVRQRSAEAEPVMAEPESLVDF